VIRLRCFWASFAGGEIELNDHQAVQCLTANQLFSASWSPRDIPAMHAVASAINSRNSFFDRSV
jgi:hypothetical protein